MASTSTIPLCAFCGRGEGDNAKYGKFVTKSSISTHNFCMLFSCALRQRGRERDGIMGFLMADITKEVRRGAKLRCVYCKTRGATIGCSIKKCSKSFHFPCGLENNSLHQYFGKFCSYCIEHRPKQDIPPTMDLVALDASGVICPMCLNPVDVLSSTDTIISPCCKNAIFHRACIQAQALNAGYFFKCPLCNDKDIYQMEMMTAGIYIPEQDASWELEDNAFQDLLFRHNRCDQPFCKCPGGADYNKDGSRWEVILCNSCGSQGCHIACGKLPFFKPRWNCSECKEIATVNVVKRVPKEKKVVRHPITDKRNTQTAHGTPAPHPMTSDSIVDRILANSRQKPRSCASVASTEENGADCSSPLREDNACTDDVDSESGIDVITLNEDVISLPNSDATSDSDGDEIDVEAFSEVGHSSNSTPKLPTYTRFKNRFKNHFSNNLHPGCDTLKGCGSNNDDNDDINVVAEFGAPKTKKLVRSNRSQVDEPPLTARTDECLPLQSDMQSNVWERKACDAPMSLDQSVMIIDDNDIDGGDDDTKTTSDRSAVSEGSWENDVSKLSHNSSENQILATRKKRKRDVYVWGRKKRRRLSSGGVATSSGLLLDLASANSPVRRSKRKLINSVAGSKGNIKVGNLGAPLDDQEIMFLPSGCLCQSPKRSIAFLLSQNSGHGHPPSIRIIDNAKFDIVVNKKES